MSNVSLAATIQSAFNLSGGVELNGIKIEGEIQPGDAQKFYVELKKDNFEKTTIFLRSLGGDVEEAIKIGQIIRRLRLTTEVPTRFDSINKSLDLIKIDNETNRVCASACFLIYAAGVERIGNLIALHRPYLPQEQAKTISDVDYIKLQNNMLNTIRKYLEDMEVNEFYIQKILDYNSQDFYLVSPTDTAIYPLDNMIPSIKEVIISRGCDPVTSHQILAADRSPSRSIPRYLEIAKENRWESCSFNALNKIRAEAASRELNNLNKSSKSISNKAAGGVKLPWIIIIMLIASLFIIIFYRFIKRQEKL